MVNFPAIALTVFVETAGELALVPLPEEARHHFADVIYQALHSHIDVSLMLIDGHACVTENHS